MTLLMPLVIAKSPWGVCNISSVFLQDEIKTSREKRIKTKKTKALFFISSPGRKSKLLPERFATMTGQVVSACLIYNTKAIVVPKFAHGKPIGYNLIN
jgi:hypothetical protein